MIACVVELGQYHEEGCVTRIAATLTHVVVQAVLHPRAAHRAQRGAVVVVLVVLDRGKGGDAQVPRMQCTQSLIGCVHPCDELQYGAMVVPGG